MGFSREGIYDEEYTGLKEDVVRKNHINGLLWMLLCLPKRGYWMNISQSGEKGGKDGKVYMRIESVATSRG